MLILPHTVSNLILTPILCNGDDPPSHKWGNWGLQKFCFLSNSPIAQLGFKLRPIWLIYFLPVYYLCHFLLHCKYLGHLHHLCKAIRIVNNYFSKYRYLKKNANMLTKEYVQNQTIISSKANQIQVMRCMQLSFKVTMEPLYSLTIKSTIQCLKIVKQWIPKMCQKGKVSN